jgi:hypothetical protein
LVDASKAYLNFVDFDSADFCERFESFIVPDSKLIVVRTGSVYDARVVASIKNAKFSQPVSVHEVNQSDIQTVISMISKDITQNIVVLLESDPDRLSTLLHAFIDRPAIIFAQTTSRYFCGNGLFVNTIAKSGTHLLNELLREFGLTRGDAFSGQLAPRTWYFAGDGPHVSAQSFFAAIGDLPYRGYFHPLFYTPKLFLYRNPLAILISMARYLGEQGNNSLNHYMRLLPLDRRIDKLIDGSMFVESFKAQINYCAPWLTLPNVIPISFEELVGTTGGGNEEAQFCLIWSLQLKLHIPGSPDYFCKQIENRKTSTLRIGKSDSFKDYLNDRHIQKLLSSDLEFMRRFGYEVDDDFSAGYLPRRASQFRHRPLRLPVVVPDYLADTSDVWSHRLEPVDIAVSSQMNSEFGTNSLRVESRDSWHAQVPVIFPQWVELHYSQMITILAVTLHAQANLSDRAPRDFRLMVRTEENERWETVIEVDDAVYESDLFRCHMDSATHCKSIRLEILLNCGGGNLLTLHKIHVQGLATVIPVTTSD